jgi:hypothetical protein
MKKIYYVICPGCQKDYYIDRELYLEQRVNPKIRLVCPYCHKEFYGKDTKFIGE